MRTAQGLIAAVVVAAAACGDDGGVVTHNDAAVDSRPIDGMPDADLDVSGSWIDSFVSSSGTTMVPACTVAPSGFLVDPTTAATTVYAGVCKANGSFRIPAMMPLGTYFLRLGTSLYETNRRTGIDMSIDRLGRSDVAAITGVTLNLDMTGLASWSATDSLVAFSPNVGYAQALSFTSGGPANGATTAMGSAPWNGYKLDASKQDTLQLVQLRAHTTPGGLAYGSLDSSFTSINVTMANSTASSIAGGFSAPPAATLQLRIDTSSFSQYASIANPSVASRSIDGNVYASVSPDALRAPSLLTFGLPETGQATLNFGTLSYGDPFASAWNRYVRIQEGFSIPYTWNNVTSSRSATMTRVVSRATADASIISASVSPVTSPKFDGADAFTATTISPVPTLSWSPPTLGSPTDYEVQVYEVTIVGTALKFTSVLKMTTKQTSVKIPSGFLLGQRQYVFSINARIRQGVDIYTTPLRAGDTSASAEVLSALVTTDS